MKLKYRAWRITGPSGRILDRYNHFPLDMLRYDPAYIHVEGMQAIIKHDTGPRPIPDSWVMIYTAMPGFRNEIMNPTIDRWASFGWANIERAKDLEDPREFDLFTGRSKEWLTVIGFDPTLQPITLTLADWLTCKNVTAWRTLVSITKSNWGALTH